MTADPQNDDRSIHVRGNVERSAVVLGDGNTVTYTTNVFGSFEAEQFPARPSQQLSQQEYRWRQVLVQNVKHYWIEGVLERSLHNQALIDLGLEERSQAVAAPIKGAEEFANESEQPFPEGTQASDIFDGLGAGRTLLILGEPGAGKTTTLLKIVKTLIERIRDDFSQSIPVVLNLSSWAKKRKSIAEWLVQDLYETFQVSKALGTTWIKEEQLTLCLDGLDEVAAQHRNECLQALNHFLQEHGRTEVIVCSRIRDYEALPEQLKVRCAIYVQPLTTQQVDKYMEQVGEPLSALRMVFSHNADIKSFATSPLILSVMSLAYRGYSEAKLSEAVSTQTFRQNLFDAYIARMFLHRGKTHRYTEQQTKHWLVWTAQYMIQTTQTIFFIERMQPTGLHSRILRLRYRLENSIIFGLIFGLSCGVWVGLLTKPVTGLMSALGSGLLFALLGNPGMLIGNPIDIQPVRTLKMSFRWDVAKKCLRNGLPLGIGFGLLWGWLAWESPWFGLLVGLLAAIVTPFLVGFQYIEVHQSINPNQGIWESARNALIVALPSGLAFIGICAVADFGVSVASFPSMMGGLFLGLIGGLLGGGLAFLQHFSLRILLYRSGYIPWNYARFLDYASERLFLQKVGGGYIFIHRMLLEHFAQMELEQKPSK